MSDSTHNPVNPASLCGLFRPFPMALFGVLLLSALGGCAFEGPEPPLSAVPAPDGPIKNLLKFGSLATDAPKAKDFVVSSRPGTDGSQFLPVHARPAARPEPVLSAQGVKEQEASLDAIRKTHDTISGRPIVPINAKSAKPRRVKPAPPEPQVN